MEEEKKKCPKCGSTAKQIWSGYNKSGTKRAHCRSCNIHYTPNPKEHAYTEEEKKQALKVYFSGASGRAVGRLLGMSKANVYRWAEEEAKKNANNNDHSK
jgi:transposase-like protein